MANGTPKDGQGEPKGIPRDAQRSQKEPEVGPGGRKTPQRYIYQKTPTQPPQRTLCYYRLGATWPLFCIRHDDGTRSCCHLFMTCFEGVCQTTIILARSSVWTWGWRAPTPRAPLEKQGRLDFKQLYSENDAVAWKIISNFKKIQKTPQGGPRRPEGVPQVPQDGQWGPQRGPKARRKGAQGLPKESTGAQSRPKSAKDAPKTPKGGQREKIYIYIKNS